MTRTDTQSLRQFTEAFLQEEAKLYDGGGAKGKARQERHGRLFVRDRLAHLLDDPREWFEIGIWAGYKMYEEFGNLPAAGVVCGIGKISGRYHMVIASDATVKAGAFFPQSVKKVLRCQRIAYQCRLPLVYLVDSAGVFLPLQEEIFPDEDDFGRIFRNNCVLSAEGIPQIAAVMGNCIAGGAYLPVLCDKTLMTEGSGLYLAGPALVKAAIGQDQDTEEIGGASMHAEISGTVDFHEPDDPSCLERIRSLVDMYPEDPSPDTETYGTENPPEAVYDLVSVDGRKEYDVRELLKSIVDEGSMEEYKSSYGKTLVTLYAKIGGRPVGVIANQKKRCESAKEGLQIGGVVYADSADKAARFIMDCNQNKIPLLFLQDVTGFMVGKQAEQSGIIRSGAKLVNAMSNATVPKITLVIGNSFGAGNYALCGKAYDPNFILAWPNARYAVMGAEQSSNTLLTVQKKAAERSGHPLTDEELAELKKKIHQKYLDHMDIRYGAAHGWVDTIIAPHTTRGVLKELFELVERMEPVSDRFHTGVIQT